MTNSCGRVSILANSPPMGTLPLEIKYEEM